MTIFWLTAVTVNWGRGYDPGEFKANVLKVMRLVDRWEHAVILPQEVDEEPDPAHEHDRLDSMLEPGTKKVFWRTREPILLSPDFRVLRARRALTMGSGEEIGGPHGTGPRRYAVTCVAAYRDVRLGFGNTHPHRRGLTAKVEDAREAGLRVFQNELNGVRQSGGGTSGIWGADMNDTYVRRMVVGERIAMERGLDHLRFWNHPHGARLTLVDQGSLNGTIDPHDPLWARFKVRG